ncbi:GNAT family N-acetyltransferase [Phenylobacterium sp.]|uniref:GNAT family N-acetyltransferase n=1 Tax=Phenylobacterium sp. TaxID=1871053 RepID=UPI002DF6788A|nr:GNAT family N-acetyltransferase [Phenylobacterium sp.]
MSLQIRVLGAGDEMLLAEAVGMIEEADLTPQRAAAHLADPDLVNVVAIADGGIVGFVYGHVLRRFEAVSFFIYSVDVAETHRRRGVGRAMLERLKALAPERGWDEMFVFTNRSNPAAMRLYASAGGVSPPPDDVVMFDFD